MRVGLAGCRWLIRPQGPYAQAVLRFQISFPDSYPRLPPLVTFSTDIFHPLITPLTTYTYTTDTRDGGTVSASDSERLPPGGFSLQHGFPDWFGRVRRAQGGAGPSGAPHLAQTPPQAPKPPLASSNDTPSSKGSSAATGDSPGFAETGRKDASTFEVLRYIRSTFDDEQVLDSIPLNAAGNPGAWHAWRTHRKNGGKVFSDTAGANSGSASPADATATKGIAGWNWDGVWEERVKKGIAASLSEPVLYGGVGGADDVVSARSTLFPVRAKRCGRYASLTWKMMTSKLPRTTSCGHWTPLDGRAFLRPVDA